MIVRLPYFWLDTKEYEENDGDNWSLPPYKLRCNISGFVHIVNAFKYDGSVILMHSFPVPVNPKVNGGQWDNKKCSR